MVLLTGFSPVTVIVTLLEYASCTLKVVETVRDERAGTVTVKFFPFDHEPDTLTSLAESLVIVDDTLASPRSLALEFLGPGAEIFSLTG